MLLNASGRIVRVNSAGHAQITGLHKGIVAVGSSSDLSILAGSSRKMGATTFHVTFGHCLASSRIGSSTLLENTASKMRASVECFGAGSFCTGILRAAVQHASNTLQWNNCLVTLLGVATNGHFKKNGRLMKTPQLQQPCSLPITSKIISLAWPMGK